MGKINIKSKAKRAVSKAHKAAADVQQRVTKAGSEDNDKLLLHQTITPKKTITKREKFRQKHKKLMNKFVLIKKQRKEEIARKNREKTAVIGDLKPLKDALPSLDELYRLSKEKKDINTTTANSQSVQQEVLESPKNVRQRLKQRREKFVKKMKSYQALLKDPDFKKNPRQVIDYHIKYTHGLIDE